MSEHYTQLQQRFEHHYLLRSAADMLEWDAQTMMGAGSGDLRAAQLATLRVLAHQVLAAEDLPELLHQAEQAPPADAWERANLTAMRRAWIHAASVPSDLVEARTRAVSRCELAWRSARKDDDFSRVRADLEEVLNLTRQLGAAKQGALGTSMYDALIDEYEPGIRTAFLTPLFAELRRELPPLIDRIVARQTPAPALVGPFPIDAQARLGRALATQMGFDFSRGRMDVSAHPFCGGAAEDVRMTTRYDEDDFLSSVMGTVHETGHALYEMGLPRRWARQPVGQAIGMAMHESQSLLMEMQAARTRPFLRYLAAQASAAFGRAISEEALAAHALHVERSTIRVDADEATYPLHIVVRYELERALIEDDLRMADLPGAFHEQMQAVVGTRADSDRDGCLQDVHWPSGAYGYFPSYTLGAIAAAQLFAAAERAHPSLDGDLERGDFSALRAFAHEHVHQHGSRESTQEVLVRATGSPFDAGALLTHLRRRYLQDA